MLGKNFITTLTDEKKRGIREWIDYTFLKEKIDFKQHFYVCGPPQFVTPFQRRSPN
jgi:ferredoxin-NADP reductase